MIKMQETAAKSWRAIFAHDAFVIGLLDGMAMLQINKAFSNVPRGFKVSRRRLYANASFLRLDAWIGEQS